MATELVSFSRTPVPARKTKANTLAETLKLFRAGKDIPEIAKERGLAVSTIESHLATAVKLGLVQVHEIIPVQEYDMILGKLPPGYEAYTLTELKAVFPPEITFGILRMFLAGLEKKKNKPD